MIDRCFVSAQPYPMQGYPAYPGTYPGAHYQPMPTGFNPYAYGYQQPQPNAAQNPQNSPGYPQQFGGYPQPPQGGYPRQQWR